jgi:putative hemolysin
MLVAIAVLCVICEAVFTAMEVALGAVSRARVRSIVEAEAQRLDQERLDQSRRHPALPSPPPRAEALPDEAASLSTPAPSHSAPAPTSRVFLRADRLLRVLDEPERLSLTFILVTSGCLWAAGGLLTWQAMRDGWAPGVLLLALAGALFFAEALPLLVAARNPEAVALVGAGLVERAVRLLSPLTWVLGRAGAAVAQLMGAREGRRPQVTEGELRSALLAAEEEGVIESDERAMLESAMEFREKAVSEVMTPRVDIVGVPALMPLRNVLQVAMREGHSRVPVYESTVDRIVGVIATKDLLPHLRPGGQGEALLARDVARAPFFLPETKLIAAALEELRRQRTLLAVVVDADGGTAGIVTLEDLLEEIVGEIEDEYDEAELPLRPVPEETALLAEASRSVREVERFWHKCFSGSLVLFQTPLPRHQLAPLVQPSAPALGEASAEAAPSQESAPAESLPHEVMSALEKSVLASESLSLAALSQRVFDGVPRVGDRAWAGVAFKTNVEREEPNWSLVSTLVEIEVLQMDGPRIEEVCLRCAAS